MPDLVLILGWAGGILGTYLLLFWLAAWWARRTPNDIDDVVVGVLQWPVLLLVILSAILNLTGNSDLSGSAKNTVSTVGNILRIGVTTWGVWRMTRDTILYYGRELAKRSEASFDDVLIPVLDVLAPVVVIGVGAILMLRLLGADISTVVLTTGGAALVIGLALRDTLGNILSGLVLLIDTPFRFGDLIIWDGIVCQIKRIGLRVTTLYNTEEHSDIYVPNSVLAQSKLTNLTRPSPDLRVPIEVSLPGDMRVEQAEGLLRETADANPYTLGYLPSKLVAIQRALAFAPPKSELQQELRWGLLALRRERQLDRQVARIMTMLDRLLLVIRGAEKGGFSEEEHVAIAAELDILDRSDEPMKKAMRLWATARTRDPHLRAYSEERARLMSDAESRIQALDRHLQELRTHLKRLGLYDMQRLDDLVVEFRDWLPCMFKPITPAWKYPSFSLKCAGTGQTTLQLVVYVDDIHLEGFLRRQRAIAALSQAATAALIHAQIPDEGTVRVTPAT